MQTVNDIMTRDPACCTRETTLEDVAKLMCEFDCGEIPVMESAEDPRPVGVVTDRDIACRTVAKGINPLAQTADSCMTSPVVTVSPETSLEECCDVLEKNQIRRVVVVDDDGRCCGIVSQADLALKVEPTKTAEVVREVSQAAHH